eukprot:2262307-Rhodomonas_salina.3
MGVQDVHGGCKNGGGCSKWRGLEKGRSKMAVAAKMEADLRYCMMAALPASSSSSAVTYSSTRSDIHSLSTRHLVAGCMASVPGIVQQDNIDDKHLATS